MKQHFIAGSFTTVWAVVMIVWPAPLRSQSSLQPEGYFSLHYSYIGSSSNLTVYNGIRVTGNVRLKFWNDRFRIVYRSHHYFHFSYPESDIFASSYRNRSVFNTAYLEARELFGGRFSFRAGRFYPTVEGVIELPVDGVQLEALVSGWSVRISGGRIVDPWDTQELSEGYQFSGSIGYRSRKFVFSLGTASLSTDTLKTQEIGGHLEFNPGSRLWVSASGAYDLKAQTLSRFNAQLSLRMNTIYFSLMYSRWENAWTQRRIHSLMLRLRYFGRFAPVPPQTYQDIRFYLTYRRSPLFLRISAGRLLGVRNGWIGTGFVRFPVLFGFQIEVGGQAIRSDYTNFYTLDGTLIRQVGRTLLKFHTQSRIYQWLPTRSGFRYADNLTEFAIEFPLANRFFLNLTTGVYFRKIGDENLKPFTDIHIMYRF